MAEIPPDHRFIDTVQGRPAPDFGQRRHPQAPQGRASSPKAPRRQSRTAQRSVPTWRACSIGSSIVFSGGQSRIGVASRGAGPLGDRSLPQRLLSKRGHSRLIFDKDFIETLHEHAGASSSALHKPRGQPFPRSRLVFRQNPPRDRFLSHCVVTTEGLMTRPKIRPDKSIFRPGSDGSGVLQPIEPQSSGPP